MTTPLGISLGIFRLLTIPSKPECLSSAPGQRPFLVGRPAVRRRDPAVRPRNPLAKPRASKRAGHAQNDGDARPGPPISAGVWSGESFFHLEQVDLVWLYSGPAGALPRCPVPCSGANLCRLH